LTENVMYVLCNVFPLLFTLIRSCMLTGAKCYVDLLWHVFPTGRML